MTDESNHMCLMLEGRNLTKQYGTKVAVSDLNVKVEKGQILGLLGPNGAGKTTTLGMLAGTVIPTRGRILISGFDLYLERPLARKYLGVVAQDNDLDDELSVLNNIYHFARYCGLGRAEARQTAAATIERFNLGEWSTMKPAQLSGGLVQRVKLARALITDPSLVLLDEPTTGLDPDVRQNFWRLTLALKNEGRSVLITTHNMEEAERLCDKLVLMKKGKIISEGTPSKVVEVLVGDEVVELSGMAIDQIRRVCGDQLSWLTQFSDGYIAALSVSNREEIVRRIVEMRPTRFLRRKANLEDVFLKLTGRGLQDDE